jgi:hypothetical protein
MPEAGPAPIRWEVTEHRGPAGLDRLEADWRRLCLETAQRSVFMTFEAARGYLQHFMARPELLRCLALSDGNRVRAICALEPRVERRLGFPVPVWGLLWFHRQSFRAEVACPDEEAQRALAPMVVAHLRRHPEGRPLLALGPLVVDSAVWDGLGQLDRRDCCLEPTERVRFLDSRTAFATLQARMSRSSRRSHETDRRRLANLPDVRWVRVQDPVQLEAEYEAFLAVEASGWKGRAGSSVADRPGLAAFLRELLGGLRGPAEHCEIAAVYAEGRCLASLFAVRTGATYSALKTGFDEAYARFSPGKLLVAETVRRCCDDPGIERLDLVGDAPWMHAWHTELTELRLAHLNLVGFRGRWLLALLKLRFGPLRRLCRWLGPRLAHQPGSKRASDPA